MTPRHFKTVRRGGQTVLRMRPAWLSYWGSGLVAVGIILLWLVQRSMFNDLAQNLGIPAQLSSLGLVIGLAPVVLRVLYHRYTHAYEIENERKLRMVAGFISRLKREFPLTDKVQTDMGQTILGRFLNYGTLAFWTGDDRSRLEWRDVPDPDRIIAFLDALKAGKPFAPPPEAEPQNQESAARGNGAVQRLPEPPTLKEAKSNKYTHFGPSPEYKQLSDMVARRIKTPFGTYIDNDDGTVTDEKEGLMWLRAPWGMVWTGAGYAGEPIQLKWNTATDLFGRGETVAYNVGSTMAYMGPEKRAAAAFRNGYKPGRCTIHAAGYKDWRLPTADELDRLSPYLHSNSSDQTDEGHGLTRDEQSDWYWYGKASKAVFKRLYPEFSGLRAHLWTANGVGGALAWAYDGGLPAGDFKIDDSKAVIFVRRITGGELTPPKTEDETVSWA